jgi:hypothetical protein
MAWGFSAFLLSGSGMQAADNPQPGAHYHFVGSDPIRTSPHALLVKQIWGLPETTSLQEATFEKLGRYLAEKFRVDQNRRADFSKLMRPLLRDVLHAESHAQWHLSEDQKLDWVFAIRLSDERARNWIRTLESLVADWKLERVPGTGPVRFRYSGAWLVIASHPELLSEEKGVIAAIHRDGRPVPEAREYWFRAEADLEQLRPWIGGRRFAELKAVQMNLKGHGDGMRTEAELSYLAPRGWRFQPWKIPAETIRDPENAPLIGFTAMQGILSWFRSPLPRSFPGEGLPGQAFVWANWQLHMHAAVPVAQPTNTVEILVEKIPAINRQLASKLFGNLQHNPERMEVNWSGLPFLIPFVRPFSETAGNFLLFGLLPAPLGEDPPPAELFQQITNRTDLVAYDWELTEPRMVQWRTALQLFSLAMHKPGWPPSGPATDWYNAILALPSTHDRQLGNTVSELVAQAPDRLKITRSSELGLTALEMIALVEWLGSPDFPEIDFGKVFRIGSPAHLSDPAP